MVDYSQFDCFFNSSEDILAYSYDAKGVQKTPLGVFLPQSVNEVSQIVKTLFNNNHFFTVRGAGSGIVGGSVAINDETYVISLEKMDEITSFNQSKKLVVCQGGVINGDLDKFLRTKGFSYPPDPASKDFSSIGGNIATNSGGLNSRKWGVTSDYVLGLTVVLPTGEVINTGQMRDDNQGKLVEHLITGSEGTLGVVCEAALRVVELAEPDSFFLVYSHSRSALFDFLTNKLLLHPNLIADNIEYIEGRIIKLVRKFVGLHRSLSHIPDNDVLIIRANSKDENFDTSEFKKFLISAEMQFLHEDENDDAQIWSIRKNMSQSMHFVGNHKINEDISIPIEKIEEFMNSLGGLPLSDYIYTFGHAGDGNLHVNIMLQDGFDTKHAHDNVKAIFKKVVALGGSLSGEHGIGYAKREFYNIEHSESEILLQKKIKQCFDSKNILNPKKIFG